MGTRNVGLILPVVGLLTGLAAAGQGAGAPAPKKIQTLLVTGQNRHDWRTVSPELRRMLEETNRFEVRVVEEFRGVTAGMLGAYDLVVLNYDNKRMDELRWGPGGEGALVEFVKRGKGLVVYHFSLAAFEGWKEYEELCGGNWRPGAGHHSPRHDFTMTVRDREHPITKGLKASIPIRNDELYANLQWQPREKYRVLATAWDDHARYGGKAKQPTPGAGMDQPMLWVHEPGGRVFVTALGHDVEAVRQAGFIATFVRGAEWAATGMVTIEAPAEVRE
jgi:uncharacterized protein